MNINHGRCCKKCKRILGYDENIFCDDCFDKLFEEALELEKE